MEATLVHVLLPQFLALFLALDQRVATGNEFSLEVFLSSRSIRTVAEELRFFSKFFIPVKIIMINNMVQVNS